MSLPIPITQPYYTNDGRPVNLDIYYPGAIQNVDKPCRALIYYHGGGLVFGNRKTLLPVQFIETLLSRGWIFISPDYHLLPESTGWDMRKDVQALGVWLKANAQSIGVDIDRIAIAGASAGRKFFFHNAHYISCGTDSS